MNARHKSVPANLLAAELKALGRRQAASTAIRKTNSTNQTTELANCQFHNQEKNMKEKAKIRNQMNIGWKPALVFIATVLLCAFQGQTNVACRSRKPERRGKSDARLLRW
jgi:hypothetical protein